MYLRESIAKKLPFECGNWDVLCQAIVEEYDASWGISITWILCGIRYLKQFETEPGGSWNVPIKIVPFPEQERDAYKIFRKPKKGTEGSEHGLLAHEFHPAWVPKNEWLQAEISQSKNLTGLTDPEQAKFHMFYDKTQATSYLEKVADWKNYKQYDPLMQKVKGRNFLTIDLIYVPPKHFMWGIDAKELYVNYE